MRASLTKRIGKLEGAMIQMQHNDSKPADLSMYSLEELEVLEKVLDYTLAATAVTPPKPRASASAAATNRRMRSSSTPARISNLRTKPVSASGINASIKHFAL
jgi:hypothetical protein